jgi:hypothetical protein
VDLGQENGFLGGDFGKLGRQKELGSRDFVGFLGAFRERGLGSGKSCLFFLSSLFFLEMGASSLYNRYFCKEFLCERSSLAVERVYRERQAGRAGCLSMGRNPGSVGVLSAHRRERHEECY